MSTVLVRALTMIAVVFQSIFNLEEPEVLQRVRHGVSSRSLGSGRTQTAYHLAGLILARGGSKGIPKKNLAEINGHPLIGRTLDAMVESGVFTSIWVSTDDSDISDWVTFHYSKQPVQIHKRAAYTATDSASSISAVLEFIGLHPEVDAIGLVQATSPFVQVEFLQEAALLLVGSVPPQYESVFSVSRSHHLRWSAVNLKNGAPTTSPLNFNPKSRPRRQDWSGEMIENGMFYFAFRHVLVNDRVFQSEKSAYVEIPKHFSLEIDTAEDLEFARCLATKFDSEKRVQGESGENTESQAQNEL